MNVATARLHSASPASGADAKPMKVLHLLSSTGYHGAENMLAELIRRLAEMGVENHLALLDNRRTSNDELLAAVQPNLAGCMVLPCPGKLNFRVAFRLREYIREHAIAISHSHKYKTNFYALLARPGTGCRLVSTCHNWLDSNVMMNFYAGLDKRLLRGFDSVVGVSGGVAAELRKYLPVHKVGQIGNGIDVLKFRRIEEKSHARKRLGLADIPTVGFIGRLSPEKGISHLLAAVKRLGERGRRLQALIVGDGACSMALEREAAALGIADRVTFLGKRTDTPLIYSALDVFVLPSLIEAFPMVVLEAMACGVPVVASAVGDVSRIIEHGESGWVVPPGDAELLSQAIGVLLADVSMQARIAASARHRVERHYSSAVMAQCYVAIYKNVCATASVAV